MAELPDYPAALQAALRGVTAMDAESVALHHAVGRVLAESIIADRDLPPFNRAQMDGYALRAAEVAAIAAFPVVDTIHAGKSGAVRVPPGSCVAIATGAPLPDDVDTVIPHEQSDRGNPVRFTISKIERGSSVHPRGVDAKAGDTLIQPATQMLPHHIGIAAAAGHTTLSVIRRPRAAILTSGDEVVAPDERVLPHQIRNSNGPMLRELLIRMGAEPTSHHHLPDDAAATSKAVESSLANSDLIISVGGVSAGERDFLPASFEKHGVTSSLRGASIQPGRPIYVGGGPRGQVVVGLPGNPVSVLACSCLFLWPIVRAMLGLSASLPWREVELMEAVKPNAKRWAFRPAKLLNFNEVLVPKWAGSGDLAHTVKTDGLLALPRQDTLVPARTRLQFLPWP